MDRVIVLNADYTYLNSISWKKAICLIMKDKAEVLKSSSKYVMSATKKIFLPLVIKLIKVIRMVYKNKVPFSKKNIMVRDGFVCQYCGSKPKKLTVDHVKPKSRGGKTSWDNCVASCKKCNAMKSNRTPREAKMSLKRQPYQPTINEFLMIKMKSLGIDEILNEIVFGKV